MNDDIVLALQYINPDALSPVVARSIAAYCVNNDGPVEAVRDVLSATVFSEDFVEQAMTDSEEGSLDELWNLAADGATKARDAAKAAKFRSLAKRLKPLPAVIPRLKFSEALLADITPDTVIEGSVWAEVGALVAVTKAGKTTLALYQCAHLVLGLPLFGRGILRPGRVLYITAEDKATVLQARYARVIQEIATEKGLLTAKQQQQAMDGVDFADFRSHPNWFNDFEGRRPTPSLLAEQIAATYPGPYTMIIVDPFASFTIDESNPMYQSALTSLRKLVDLTGAAVQCLCHVGQEAAKAKDANARRSLWALRGMTAFVSGLRFVQVLDRAEQGEATSNEPDVQCLVLAQPGCQFGRTPDPVHLERRGFSLTRVQAPLAAPKSAKARPVPDPSDIPEKDVVKEAVLAHVKKFPNTNQAFFVSHRTDIHAKLSKNRLLKYLLELTSEGHIEVVDGPNNAKFYSLPK